MPVLSHDTSPRPITAAVMFTPASALALKLDATVNGPRVAVTVPLVPRAPPSTKPYVACVCRYPGPTDPPPIKYPGMFTENVATSSASIILPLPGVEVLIVGAELLVERLVVLGEPAIDELLVVRKLLVMVEDEVVE